MLQKVDGARLAAIARARHLWQVRKRLRYPDAARKLKVLKAAEQRVLAGEPEPVKPRVIPLADEITEERIERYQAQYKRETWRWWR